MPLTLFQAGGGGYAQCRIPALARTPSGVLIALCEGRWAISDTGDINIIGRRSADGGQTWSPQQVVLSHGHDTAGNPTVVVDPVSGDVVLLSCRNGEGDTYTEIAKGLAPPRRVYVQRSGDDGVTWSDPEEITDQVTPPASANWSMRWYATGPGHGVAITSGAHAGRIVVPCNHTRTPSGGDTGGEPKYAGGHLIYSDDGGVSWALGATSSNPNGDVNEDEATMAVLSDGQTLYANCRCGPTDLQPGNRADAISVDGGQSLQQPHRPQATIVGAVCQGSVISLPDGRLLYSGPSYPSEDTSKRAAMALRVSEDEGETWRVGYQVSGRPAAYSDMALLGTDTIGLLYETGDFSPYQDIRFLRIPIADID